MARFVPEEKKMTREYRKTDVVGLSRYASEKPTDGGKEVLLKSSIADCLSRVEAAREKMKRDQKEIDRLRVATDKILGRLRAV